MVTKNCRNLLAQNHSKLLDPVAVWLHMVRLTAFREAAKKPAVGGGGRESQQ
jgi:hypothetical protein